MLSSITVIGIDMAEGPSDRPLLYHGVTHRAHKIFTETKVLQIVSFTSNT